MRVIYNCFFFFLFVILCNQSTAQNEIKKMAADKAFERLLTIQNSQCGGSEMYTNLMPDEKKEVKRCAEIKSHVFREEGLKLWDSFKNDKRRYEWFYKTVMDNRTGLHYWLNIDSGIDRYMSRESLYSNYDVPIDWKKLNEWNSRYHKLKEGFFSYLIKTSNSEDVFHQKNSILVKELEAFLKLSLNEDYRCHKKIDIKQLKELFVAASKCIEDYEGRQRSVSKEEKVWLTAPLLRAMDNDFFSCYREFGLTIDDMRYFIDILKNEKIGIIDEWCAQRYSLLELRDNPLELNYTSIDGRQIDLRNFRGKVVLVDIWSTSCSSCIARMPAIKKIYEKYKSSGFEVVSICFNYGNEMKKIIDIENKIRGGWPILMLGGQGTDVSSREQSPAGQLFKKYGFFGVPQLLLFDKQGRLALLNDILRDGDFEPNLKQLINN